MNSKLLLKRFLRIAVVLSLFVQLMPVTAMPLSAQASLPDKGQVAATLYKVNEHWLDTLPVNENGEKNFGDSGWKRSVYFLGDMAHYQMSGNLRYLDAADSWAKQNNWNLFQPCVYDNGWKFVSVDADDQMAGQTYLPLNLRNSYEWQTACLKESINRSMNWAWLTIDLSSTMTINRVNLYTYNNRAYRYYIDVATTAEGPFTPVVNRHANATQTDGFADTFAAVAARYVRLTVVGATGYGGKIRENISENENWVSIRELEVFGEGASTPNLALNKPATCSSEPQPKDNPCKNAVDGKTDSRWSASFPVPEYVTHIRDSMNWWWIDAIFMSMPVYAQFYTLENNPRYAEVMNVRYHYARDEAKKDDSAAPGLLDRNYGLWYRDPRYVSPPSISTGASEPIFWSRGNGWVFAALARTLQILPPTAPYYAEYLADFKALADKVIAAQQPQGYWTTNLLFPQNFPGGESSGTSLFAYGLAWGINSGHLVGNQYRDAVTNAWNWLATTAVREDGVVQYVQQEGSHPGTVTADSTTDFGVGLLLLAGSEVYKLAPNPVFLPLVTVNSTADPGNGLCDSKECTLREAIAVVAPGGTINFNLTLPVTIKLYAGQLLIDKPLTINGPGAAQLNISGGGTSASFRVLRTSATPVNINGVTIREGATKDRGAGIYNTGTLSLKDVVVRDNYSYSYGVDPVGGGICNAEKAILYLDNVTIHANKAYEAGGGIANLDDASVYMQNTRITENSAELFSGWAGGISNSSRGKFWIQIAPNGDWLPGSSLIYRNEAGGAAAFRTGGDMRIVHTMIEGNTSFNGSPAIMSGGFTSIVESTIRGNGTGENYGGALWNYGTTELISSLVYGNSAEKGTGGITNGGQFTIANSTIGTHYTRRDQGVIDNGGTMTITNSTLNELLTNPNYGEAGYGIRNNGTLKMGNSIIANGTVNCSGPILSIGNNISSDGTCALNGPNDRNNVDPKLDVLKDNGGPTLTYALLPGSPAIDAADNAQCPTTDQRNQARPQDGNGDGKAVCDIGSYEAPTAPSTQAIITIRQETQPKSIQDFAYYGPFGKFYLDDTATDDGDAYPLSRSYTVNPGTYNFAQGVFQSWHLANIQCVGTGQSTNNMSMRSVGIMVKAGEQMLCTFVTHRRVNLEALKYNDLNGNGGRDTDEPLLAGWEIRFYRSDGSLINHKVTDANGSAKQINVIPGSFKVCETAKAGWANTQPRQIDPLLGVPCYNITLLPGNNYEFVFGNTQSPAGRSPEASDPLQGVTMSPLPDINEPESEAPIDEQVEQNTFLPLISR